MVVKYSPQQTKLLRPSGRLFLMPVCMASVSSDKEMAILTLVPSEKDDTLLYCVINGGHNYQEHDGTECSSLGNTVFNNGGSGLCMMNCYSLGSVKKLQSYRFNLQHILCAQFLIVHLCPSAAHAFPATCCAPSSLHHASDSAGGSGDKGGGGGGDSGDGGAGPWR